MGTDGGKFDVSDRVTSDRLNRKTVLVDTGANIAAATPAPGMMAYCTVTGSGFTAGIMYRRNAANTAWEEVVDLASVQAVQNKTVNVDQNTVKDSATNLAGDLLVNNGTKFVRRARGSAHQVPQMNSGGTDIEFAKLDPENLNALTVMGNVEAISFSTTSTSYVDITGATVTITAKGSKTALVTWALFLYSTSAVPGNNFIALTDGSNNIITNGERGYFIASGLPGSGASMEYAAPGMIIVEAAPSAGSLTRKFRIKRFDAGSVQCSDLDMLVIEVV